MAKSKHNTTKRGTQKQRVRTHDAYLKASHPAVWQAKVDRELLSYRIEKAKEQADA